MESKVDIAIRRFMWFLVAMSIIIPLITVMALGKLTKSIDTYINKDNDTCYRVYTGGGSSFVTPSEKLKVRMDLKGYKTTQLSCDSHYNGEYR